MLTRILAMIVVVVLVFATAAMISTGTAGDDGEARIADLETRVAALETAVAAGERGPAGEDGESGSSSSSNQSSASFSGVYSGSGNRTVEIDLDSAGTYQLALTSRDGAGVILLDTNDEPVDAFTIDTGSTGTTTRISDLAAGAYLLDVRSDGSWSVILVLVG